MNSKGQLTLQFLLTFMIWIAVLSALAVSLLYFSDRDKKSSEILTEKFSMNWFSSLLEQVYFNKNHQFLHLPQNNSHYSLGYSISEDYRGQVIVQNTLYGVNQSNAEPV